MSGVDGSNSQTLPSCLIAGGDFPYGLGQRLVHVASDYFDIDPDSIFSRHKHGQITAARRSIGYVLIDSVGWSAARVGRFFGQAHPSILSGFAESQRLLRKCPIFFEAVIRLEQEIYGVH